MSKPGRTGNDAAHPAGADDPQEEPTGPGERRGGIRGGMALSDTGCSEAGEAAAGLEPGDGYEPV
jgi:hypothetical protein